MRCPARFGVVGAPSRRSQRVSRDQIALPSPRRAAGQRRLRADRTADGAGPRQLQLAPVAADARAFSIGDARAETDHFAYTRTVTDGSPDATRR